jgi:hypothetical protein
MAPPRQPTQQELYDAWLAQNPDQGPQGGNGWINGVQPDGSIAGAQVSTNYRPPQQQQAPSTTEQVTGAGASIAGNVAGHYAANQLNGLFSNPAPAASTAPAAASAAPAAPAVVEAGFTGANAANATMDAGTWGAQAVNDYNMIVDAGSNAASLGAEGAAANAAAQEAAAGTPWFDVGGPSYAGYLGAAASVASLAMNWDDWKAKGNDYLATRGEQQIAEAVGNYFTGGLAGAANQGIRAVAPHFMNEVDEFATKYGLLGNVVRAFGSSKDKDQLNRDKVRGEMKQFGFLDPDYTLTLPDGTKFDFGKDGNARLPNDGVDPISGQPWRHYHDVDWSKGGSPGVVAAVNPLAAAMSHGDEKLTKDFAGYLTNAVTASGDPMENIRYVMDKAGFDHDKLYGTLHLMSKSQGGNVDDELINAYKNGLDQTFGVGAYAGKGPQFGTPDIQPGQKPAYKTGGQVAPVEVPKASNTQVSNPQAGSPQQRVEGRKSPFTGPRSGVLAASPNPAGGRVRLSPGVWQDPQGVYNSKTGTRGQ